MPHDRFFVSKIGEALPPEELRHLKVMRIKVGEKIELIDGQGNLSIATVQEKGYAVESTTHFPKPFLKVKLMLAIPQPSHLDWVIEKATELGVDTFSFFPGKLSDFKTVKIERLERIIIAATKQSGRLYLPKMELLPPLPKGKKEIGFFGSMLSQDPHLLDLIDPKSENLTFFVGPERGFDKTEIELLKSWGCQGARLNINTLRTETASVTAAALLLTRNTNTD